MGVPAAHVNWRQVPPEAALNQIGKCAFIFCGQAIHFRDRAIQRGEQLFCCEDHYVLETGGRIVQAGTGERTI